MKINRPPVLTVEASDPDKFEAECQRLFEADYRMDSSSCGFVNSAENGFCSSYHAVFVDKYFD